MDPEDTPVALDTIDVNDDESPLALQLAVRVEKLTPPTVPAICASTVLATIGLLAHEQSQFGGDWHDAVASWNGARIRKLVRRGRASAWDRAQAVPGVTVERDGAEVRAFVPGPMNQAPAEITRLQIQSSPLAPVTLADRVSTSVTASTMCIAITPHVEMSWGKQAAQFAHAGQRVWMLGEPEVRAAWHEAGCPVEIVFASIELWPQLEARSCVQIRDGGFTEIPPNTLTTVAWWGPV